jgi:predicted MFS family arabinose efflux permease
LSSANSYVSYFIKYFGGSRIAMSSRVELAELKANLWKLSVLRGLEFAWFPIPTIMLFYHHNGLTIQDGLLLKTILSISIFLFEVPSGGFADVFAKRTSLISAGFVWMIATTCYIFGDSFIVFALAEVLCGIAVSLISGADVAIAYDSLVAIEAEGEYVKVEGKLVSVSSFSEAACGIIGAYFASLNLRYPFVLMLGANIAFVFFAFSLKEPPRQNSGHKKSVINQMVHVASEVFHRKPIVLFLCLYSGVCSAGTFLIVWLSQSYMESIHIPVEWFGLLWAFFHIWMGVLSFYAFRFEQKLGTANTFIGIAATLGCAYIGLAFFHSLWGLAAVFLLYGLRGVKTPIVRAHLNRQLPSDIRATALSLESFLFRLLFAGLGPFAGAIVAGYSLSTGLLVAGIVLLAGATLMIVCLFRVGMFSFPKSDSESGPYSALNS